MILCRECSRQFSSDETGDRAYQTHDCSPRFSASKSRQKREEALDRVARRQDWCHMAEEGITRLALAGEPFTSDDLLKLVPELEGCEEPRVIGAAFRLASNAEVIVPTGQYVDSNRVASHRRPKREWVKAPVGVW